MSKMSKTQRTPPSTPRDSLSPNPIPLKSDDSSSHVTMRKKMNSQGDFDLRDYSNMDNVALIQSLMKKMFSEFEDRQNSRLDVIENKMSAIKVQNDSIHGTNTAIEKSIADVSLRLDDFQKTIARFETERKEIASDIFKIQDRCEAIDRSLKKTSVEIRNVPKVKGERPRDLFANLEKLCIEFGLEFNTSEVRDIYRLPSKKEHTTSTVIVEFVNTLFWSNFLVASKNYFKTNKRDLFATSLGLTSESKIYISEALTAKNRRLFHMAKDLKREAVYSFCWTAGGNIYLKKAEGSIPILVHGSWGLPAFMCDIYIAMDVTSSTSSIFNLVAISVDRYIAVTQPIKYAKHKNNRRVWFTIVLVWLISATIGAPIVLGLNDTPDRNFDECLFNSQNYVIYSSLGSFYIPCIMMMFLYYNIFKALSIRAKKQRAAKKPPVSGDPTTGATTAVVIENVAQTRRLQETALHDDRPTNTGSGSNEGEHDDSFDKRSGDLEADADECHVIRNDKSAEFMLATVREETANNTPKKFKQPVPDPNGNNDSGYAPSNLEDTIREHGTPPGSPGMKNATVLKNMGYDGSRKNGKPKDTESRTVSLHFRSEDDLETSHYDVRDGSSSKKERKASTATARFTIYKANKASKKKREKSSARKERKATKTLAIVLGVFLFCWAPFFTCNVLDAICVKLNLPFSPGVTVFILTTWLGYINSFLNPVIYTIFNPEFRKAFRKILKCGP